MARSRVAMLRPHVLQMGPATSPWYLPCVGGRVRGGLMPSCSAWQPWLRWKKKECARLRCFQHLGRCLVAARRRRSSAPRAPAAPSARVLLGAVARHAGIVDGYGVSELTASPSLPPCTRLCALSVGPEADPEHLLRSLGLCAL